MRADVLEKPATVENPLREVSKIRSRVTDAVEDGVRSRRATTSVRSENLHAPSTQAKNSLQLRAFFGGLAIENPQRLGVPQ